MQVTVQIHEAWLARPEDLRRVMALLAGLEVPPPSGAGPRQTAAAPAPDPGDYEEPFYPEEHAPARPSNRPDRGDAWEPPTGEPTDDAPTDGRQLLGWSGKQVPDAKGLILSYGRKNGLPSKIVGWSPQQVAAAYRFARGRLASTTR